MSAICHQTGTFDLLSIRNENNIIHQDMILIASTVKNIRGKYSLATQNEAYKKITSDKQSDKILANLGILILLDPSLTNFKTQNSADQKETLLLIELFVLNNDPYQFHKILKIVPTRIDNILNGFYKIMQLYLQALIKYTNQQLPNNLLARFIGYAKPYINYNSLSFLQTKLI